MCLFQRQNLYCLHRALLKLTFALLCSLILFHYRVGNDLWHTCMLILSVYLHTTEINIEVLHKKGRGRQLSGQMSKPV